MMRPGKGDFPVGQFDAQNLFPNGRGIPSFASSVGSKSCARISSEEIIGDDITLALVNARSSKCLSTFLSISARNKYQDVQ